jgi:hypothetical protein
VDLVKMHEAAQVLGFGTDSIRVLANEAARADSIRDAIADWLIDGTAPGDRVLLYYSGHGSTVRDRRPFDEVDGWDEVLTGHDVRLDWVDSQLQASGVVTDDELFELLSRLTGRDVTVIIDACTSGSATRGAPSGDGGAARLSGRVAKSGPLEVQPTRDLDAPGPTRHRPSRARQPSWATLTAAADDRLAYGTPWGSDFTQALHTYLLEARYRASTTSPTELTRAVSNYLAERHGTEPWVPAPVLTGPLSARHKPLPLRSSVTAQPVRAQLEALSTDRQIARLWSPPGSAAGTSPAAPTVRTPAAGYLNVIRVDPDDRALVLFPNGADPDNLLAADTELVIEGFEASHARAADPAGDSYLLAVFTDVDSPLNFYRDAVAEFGETLGVSGGFARLSSTATLRARQLQKGGGSPDTYQAEVLPLQSGSTP